MQHNRSRGTRIEHIFAHALRKQGLHYRRNDTGIEGSPDFTFRLEKVAIFCDGEFWHGRDYPDCLKRIKTNRSFWVKKIERNRSRDQKVDKHLTEQGWCVLHFWESDIRKRTELCINQVVAILGQRQLPRLHRSYSYDTQYDDLLFAAEEDESYK